MRDVVFFYTFAEAFQVIVKEFSWTGPNILGLLIARCSFFVFKSSQLNELKGAVSIWKNAIVAESWDNTYVLPRYPVSVNQWSGRPCFNPRSRHTEDLKMLLGTSSLNTQQYKVRIEGKVDQSRESSSAHSYIWV